MAEVLFSNCNLLAETSVIYVKFSVFSLTGL